MERRADPYRDLAVIDARAPRVNQTVVAVLAIVAAATGWWPLVLALGVQLAVAVRFGRRWCLPCRLYFDVIQPRLGEGPLEDARAPRFANIIGAGFLLAAATAWAIGWSAIGLALTLVVAALATVAVTTGLCVGCELYRIGARLRGVRGGAIDRVDLDHLARATGSRPAIALAEPGEVVVLFTHPLCGECQTVKAELAEGPRPVVAVDVSRHRDLARKYGLALVPLAVAVGADGRVTSRVR
ncbi:MAG TPA: DUF4395 family protein [Kofleriaceae bacterium]|nr:DUF4395 family protein [Kofleriaceae bacterium]